MAIFSNEAQTYQRLDFALLQNGPVTMYWRPEVLAADLAWLAAERYVVDDLDAGSIATEDDLHDTLAAGLRFPDYYGRNLSALDDCVSDLEIPEASGRVVVLRGFDRCHARLPEVAWRVVDIFAGQSWSFLLFGRRLLLLLQSDDPQLRLEPVGARGVSWNGREWLDSARRP